MTRTVMQRLAHIHRMLCCERLHSATHARPSWRAGLGGAGSILCILVALPLAARAEGGPDRLVETEMSLEGGVVTFVAHRGRRYRHIEISDLEGMRVGSANLNDLAVCVEGKFEGFVARDRFRLMGSDRDFRLARPGTVMQAVSGDNVWVGGMAKKVRGVASCYMEVFAVARLPGDEELFKQRLEKHYRAGSWEKLLALGRWVEIQGKLASSHTITDTDRYKLMSDKAYLEALRIREREVAAEDAPGHYELARMCKRLLGGRRGRMKAFEHLRRTLRSDPKHQGALNMLRELGFVRFGGKWVRKEDLAAHKARERTDPVATTDTTHPEGDPVRPARAPVRRLSASERARALLELELKARAGPAGLKTVAEAIPGTDEAVARRLVWILANTGGTAGLDGLIKGLESGSAAVRRDVADALAWSRFPDALAQMIRSEEDGDVRLHAVSALSGAGTREEVDALVSLLSMDDAPVRIRIGEELRRLTGQTIAGREAWESWWDANGEAFKGPREAP